MILTILKEACHGGKDVRWSGAWYLGFEKLGSKKATASAWRPSTMWVLSSHPYHALD